MKKDGEKAKNNKCKSANKKTEGSAHSHTLAEYETLLLAFNIHYSVNVIALNFMHVIALDETHERHLINKLKEWT